MNMETKVGYEAKNIGGLPLKIKLPGGMDLTLNYMKENQFGPGYDLVKDAALRGDNVGIDEFADIDSYANLVRIAHCFVVQNPTDDLDTIRALILILPDNSGGSMDPVLAEIRMFLSADIWMMSPDIVGALVRLGERFVVDLELGYLASVVNVSLPCSKWIHALKDEGYLIVATLPKIVDHLGRGLVESCKLYKRLQQGTRPNRPYDVIVRVTKELLDIPSDEEFTHRTLPTFQCLPLQFRFKTGQKVILRNQRHDDDVTLFNLFTEAAKSGQGFGSDEIAGISYFHFEFLLYYKACVIEDAARNFIIGVVFVGPSYFRRTCQNALFETMTLLHPDYRRKGLGDDMIQIGMGLLKEEGLVYVLNNSIMTNVPIQKVISYNPMFEIITVGVLPMASHVAGYGYVDNRFEFCTIRNVKPLPQLSSERMALKSRM